MRNFLIWKIFFSSFVSSEFRLFNCNFIFFNLKSKVSTRISNLLILERELLLLLLLHWVWNFLQKIRKVTILSYFSNYFPKFKFFYQNYYLIFFIFYFECGQIQNNHKPDLHACILVEYETNAWKKGDPLFKHLRSAWFNFFFKKPDWFKEWNYILNRLSLIKITLNLSLMGALL